VKPKGLKQNIYNLDYFLTCTFQC